MATIGKAFDMLSICKTSNDFNFINLTITGHCYLDPYYLVKYFRRNEVLNT